MSQPKNTDRDSVRPFLRNRKQTALITGGAGFIGTNVAERLLSNGFKVILFDNLSRPGVWQNVEWLKREYGDDVQLRTADVRDRLALRNALSGVDNVFHFAAQVAVTTSLIDPTSDFMTNVFGTFCLLEELRQIPKPPTLVFTSTNKVYGCLDDLLLRKDGTRYEPLHPLLKEKGIGEEQPLNFHSPYGCSKGAADQYVLDYARIFGIPAVVFRMSCIYGPHQMGTEDQGWVAHFLIRALENKTITFYGDGMQIRDILFVDDLVDAFLAVLNNMETVRGQVFNIGGGANNTISLVELIEIINKLRAKKTRVEISDWRTGDQKYYVSNTRKFHKATGWLAKTSVREGIEQLYDWLVNVRGELKWGQNKSSPHVIQSEPELVFPTAVKRQ
jgi:CDP-paratose 2-epimerase